MLLNAVEETSTKYLSWWLFAWWVLVTKQVLRSVRLALNFNLEGTVVEYVAIPCVSVNANRGKT